jgi:hypothetical protein
VTYHNNLDILKPFLVVPKQQGNSASVIPIKLLLAKDSQMEGSPHELKCQRNYKLEKEGYLNLPSRKWQSNL